MTWGHSYYGGDSSGVQDQLKNVQKICRTDVAFAAILADGSVVTWGNPLGGADSSRVQDQLRNVQQISSTCRAFAAILADGTVVTWGRPDFGGPIQRVHGMTPHEAHCSFWLIRLFSRRPLFFYSHDAHGSLECGSGPDHSHSSHPATSHTLGPSSAAG